MLHTITSNMTQIVQSLGLLSSTKDSLHVKWTVDEEYVQLIQGFQVCQVKVIYYKIRCGVIIVSMR